MESFPHKLNKFLIALKKPVRARSHAPTFLYGYLAYEGLLHPQVAVSVAVRCLQADWIRTRTGRKSLEAETKGEQHLEYTPQKKPVCHPRILCQN